MEDGPVDLPIYDEEPEPAPEIPVAMQEEASANE